MSWGFRIEALKIAICVTLFCVGISFTILGPVTNKQRKDPNRTKVIWLKKKTADEYTIAGPILLIVGFVLIYFFWYK